jgi:hypothetical protein
VKNKVIYKNNLFARLHIIDAYEILISFSETFIIYHRTLGKTDVDIGSKNIQCKKNPKLKMLRKEKKIRKRRKKTKNKE